MSASDKIPGFLGAAMQLPGDLGKAIYSSYKRIKMPSSKRIMNFYSRYKRQVPDAERRELKYLSNVCSQLIKEKAFNRNVDIAKSTTNTALDAGTIAAVCTGAGAGLVFAFGAIKTAVSKIATFAKQFRAARYSHRVPNKKRSIWNTCKRMVKQWFRKGEKGKKSTLKRIGRVIAAPFRAIGQAIYEPIKTIAQASYYILAAIPVGVTMLLKRQLSIKNTWLEPIHNTVSKGANTLTILSKILYLIAQNLHQNAASLNT